jgi:hypothetical protein
MSVSKGTRWGQLGNGLQVGPAIVAGLSDFCSIATAPGGCLLQLRHDYCFLS